jgi:imidazoleglycerol-phosphate dehydratase / histidinol-phosphatase
MKKVLFIDRDGTIIKEAPDEVINSFLKVEFLPNVFKYLRLIAEELDYELVMVTNQDGLGTAFLPDDVFWPIQQFIMKALENEGIKFKAVHIDHTFYHENAPTRKPQTGMLTGYMGNNGYDLANSFVIGDRLTDVELAYNLGSKGIWINQGHTFGNAELSLKFDKLKEYIPLEATNWQEIYEFLKAQ